MKKIGVLGAGAMGRGMIKNLIESGYEVYVYDPSSKAQEISKNMGADVLNSPREVGAVVEILLASLPTSQAVKDSICGENGALQSLKEQSIICDMSTTAVSTEKELYALCKEKEIGYLDCPVSGGPMGAENATMSIMVGGDKEIFDKSKEVFNIIGGNIFYLGKSGSGQTIKICHNMVLAVTTISLVESFITAVKAGVNPKTLADVFKVSVAKSGTLDVFGDNLVNGTYEKTIFALSHMHKDANLYMGLADELKTPSPVSSVVYQLFNAAINKGLGSKDQTAVAEVLEEMSDFRIAFNQ
ncbi:NAD(P)-dependent oxidoreductase [Maledivibacter halophilus]|uniref:3-hydroxyisobutyrate dehydrogenase n=1 Tax=Maledivibacter halophilus TaxID=36842 RepID=A0A1T5M071_9FIRM|nr:NAD(P)-dependent oxidoreductase [Maledivibacter halophilus]SKC81626.1 3-hydroxyisobutyrate dehydrogenase [Maledivibacter halophilus]